MMNTEIYEVAVLGAGLSGLAAARCLRDAGLKVVVVEKSKGLGGRAASRRVSINDEVEVPVDHGAQFFTARDDRFKAKIALWMKQGICFPWSEGFFAWRDGALHPPNPEMQETRYACHHGMTSLSKELALSIPVIRDFQVESVLFNQGIWNLYRAESQKLRPVFARDLIVSAPLPQALKLIGMFLSAEQLLFLDQVECHPCVAVIACYQEETPVPEWQGIQLHDPETKLLWICWDSSRREHGAQGSIAVLHGGKQFSNEWLAASPEILREAGKELLAEAGLIAGEWMAHPNSYIVHRWRYVQQEGAERLAKFLRAVSAPLWLIGDGMCGGRIEGAWMSGVSAAEEYLLHRKAIR